MEAFIRQLTGVRFIAAAWVMLYHFQLPLDRVHLLVPVISDFFAVGRLGVDLFFALSGFILTHTYLRKLGPKATVRSSARFWWLRLARIYPVHFVTLQLAWIAILLQPAADGTVTEGSSSTRDWLNPLSYVKQLLFIQEWGANPTRGWNFVAWSLSMEWLAYLIFPLLVLALWRFNRSIPTSGLVGLWVVAVAPLTALAITRQNDPYYQDNWASTTRILTEFTAGALTYLIVLRFTDDARTEPRPRVERLATTLSVAMPVLVVAGAFGLAHVTALQWPGQPGYPPRMHLLLVPPLIIWIGALALSRRGLALGLSTPALLLGGYISFSLYMTHRFVYGFWRTAMRVLGINGGFLYFLALIALVGLCLLAAYAMWRWIEEPAREWMRRLIGEKPKPLAEPTIGKAVA